VSIFKNIDVEQLIEFIFLRYKEDGGFAAFPSLPSTIEAPSMPSIWLKSCIVWPRYIALIPSNQAGYNGRFYQESLGGQGLRTRQTQVYLV